MKYNRFCSKTSFVLICAGLLLSSCDKGPQMSFPKEDIIFDASGLDTMTVHISANVHWTAVIKQTDQWLKADILKGEGDAIIKLAADENGEFAERIAFVVITGDDVGTDSIRVIQTETIDVAEMIENETLKKYCLYLFDDSPQDGRISLKEAKSDESKIENGQNIPKTKIIIKGLQITTLAGIEYFTKIRELNCENNLLEEIDISKNKEIRILNCSYNSKIDRIDVSGLARLSSLKLYNANLTNIDVSKNEALRELWVSNNSISSINVSNNKDLDILNCSNNLLTSLDVSKNSNLMNLSCTDNKLTTLNISANTKLATLYCSVNQLSNIDVRSNKDLQVLWCVQTGISNLDITNNTNLSDLRCDNNNLTTLDLSHNTKLRDFSCSSNKIKNTIDISNNILLRYIDLKNNPELTEIKVWQGFDIYNKDYYLKDDTADWVPK